MTNEFVKELTLQIKETEEDFIYENIMPYCENVTRMKLNKADLKRILRFGIIAEHLTDRPCSACKFHSKKGCSKWSCPFDEVLKGEGVRVNEGDSCIRTK